MAYHDYHYHCIISLQDVESPSLFQSVRSCALRFQFTGTEICFSLFLGLLVSAVSQTVSFFVYLSPGLPRILLSTVIFFLSVLISISSPSIYILI